MRSFSVTLADYKIAMFDAVALSRWNARMAIELHTEASNFVSSLEDMDTWNVCAKHINHTIDNISTQSYFKDEYARGYWGFDPKSTVRIEDLPTTRLEYI